MDDFNTRFLAESKAHAKLLLDANVLIYAQEAFRATNLHLLEFLDQLSGRVDWYVASCVALKLHNGGSYDVTSLDKHVLNCDDIGMKMDSLPFIKENGDLGFVKLNALAGDDWAQICLAHNNPELIIATNDSAMFRSAHASLEGRAIAFHDLLDKLSPYWTVEPAWLRLKTWLIENKQPLRNNGSWIIDGQRSQSG